MSKNINFHSRAYFILINRAGRIERTVKNSLKPFGITHTQLNILSVLNDSFPNPLTAKAIKERLVVVSPDLTRLIDRLVKKELTDRKTCEDNRRKIDITITAKGVKLYQEAHIAVKAATQNFYKNSITADEAEQLAIILSKIEN